MRMRKICKGCVRCRTGQRVLLALVEDRFDDAELQSTNSTSEARVVLEAEINVLFLALQDLSEYCAHMQSLMLHGGEE